LQDRRKFPLISSPENWRRPSAPLKHDRNGSQPHSSKLHAMHKVRVLPPRVKRPFFPLP